MHKNNSTSYAKLHELNRADYNKLKKVLTILKSERDDPRARRRYSGLFQCVWRRSFNIVHFFTRSRTVKTGLARCQLRQRCPCCMSARKIIGRRQDDFKLLEHTAETIGGGRYGTNAACWLIECQSETRLSPKKFIRILTRADRKQSLLTEPWAGEAAVVELSRKSGPLESINNHTNGREGSRCFVFIALLTGLSPSALDEAGLQKFVPNCRIERFHRNLRGAWKAYLDKWSRHQIDSRTPEEIVDWMMGRAGERDFQALGKFRGVKSRTRKSYLDWLHKWDGNGIRLTIFDCFEDPDQVMQRIESAVQSDEHIEPEEWDRVLAAAARQVGEVMNDRPETEHLTGKQFKARAAVEYSETERRDAIRDLFALGLVNADGSELSPYAQALLRASYPEKYRRRKSAGSV